MCKTGTSHRCSWTIFVCVPFTMAIFEPHVEPNTLCLGLTLACLSVLSPCRLLLGQHLVCDKSFPKLYHQLQTHIDVRLVRAVSHSGFCLCSMLYLFFSFMTTYCLQDFVRLERSGTLPKKIAKAEIVMRFLWKALHIQTG